MSMVVSKYKVSCRFQKKADIKLLSKLMLENPNDGCLQDIRGKSDKTFLCH